MGGCAPASPALLLAPHTHPMRPSHCPITSQVLAGGGIGLSLWISGCTDVDVEGRKGRWGDRLTTGEGSVPADTALSRDPASAGLRLGAVRDRSPSPKAPAGCPQALGLTGRHLDEERPGQAGEASCSCSEGGKESQTGQTPLGIEQLTVALHLGGRDRSITRSQTTLGGAGHCPPSPKPPLWPWQREGHTELGSQEPWAGWWLEGFGSSQDTGLRLCPLLTSHEAGQWPHADGEYRPLQPHLASSSRMSARGRLPGSEPLEAVGLQVQCGVSPGWAQCTRDRFSRHVLGWREPPSPLCPGHQGDYSPCGR